MKFILHVETSYYFYLLDVCMPQYCFFSSSYTVIFKNNIVIRLYLSKRKQNITPVVGIDLKGVKSEEKFSKFSIYPGLLCRL